VVENGRLQVGQMASYRIISPTLWQDPEFRELPPLAGYMLVQIRLMATNIIALYKPDWELIGELTRLDRDGRKAVLAELGKPKKSGSPWLLHEDGYAWVVNGFRHEFGFGDNGLPRRPSGQQIKAVERALAGIPRHVTLVQQFALYYACPNYPELGRVLIPYRRGIDTPSIHPARETGSGTGSGTGTPCASSSTKTRGGGMKDPNVRAVMDWFYGRWSAVNGGQGFPVKSVPYPKEYKAAERILASYPDYPTKLTGLLDGALAGHYFAAPPDCIANFKPSRYTAGNRKQGAPPPQEVAPQEKSAVELMRERGEVE